MEPEIVDVQIRRFLKFRGLLEDSQLTPWKIAHSKLSGRGIIATRDIECNELVYADAAVVIGPRCYRKYLPMCVSCCKSDCVLFSCDRGCGLPVCSDACQDDPRHVQVECTYLQELQPTCGASWSLELLQAVVPIRALLLPQEQREIFYFIQCHEAPQHGREVNMLKRNVKNTISMEDEKFMRQVCRAMDTNSFETAVVQNKSSTSLRALFPLGALTNHQCIPNTRHIVNDKGELLVYSTMPIAKGDEITMSYTDLFWDTTARREFLRMTKHFSCQCLRCSDVTECGTLLGVLFCAKDKCPGNLLPDAPLNFTSAWKCDQCGLIIKNKQIAAIRSGIAASIEEVLYTNPRRILKFVQRELSVLIPETNYIMMEMMCRIVSLLGRVEEYSWQELTDEDLNTKIRYCKKLVQHLDKLNCGDCTKKGLILYELYCSNVEKLRRASSKEDETRTLLQNEISPAENEEILHGAIRILKNDIGTPSDYRDMYDSKSSMNNESAINLQ